MSEETAAPETAFTAPDPVAHIDPPPLGPDKQVQVGKDHFIASRHPQADSYIMIDGAHIIRGEGGQLLLQPRDPHQQQINLTRSLEECVDMGWPVYGFIVRRDMLRAGIPE